MGSIPGLDQWVKDQMLSRVVVYRSQMRLGSLVAVALAIALIRPLAWESPCAVGAALEKTEYLLSQVTTITYLEM